MPRAEKRFGRPATGKGTPVHVRLQPDHLALLDRWIAEQPEPVSRPEAMRRLSIMALQGEGVG